MYVQRNIPLSFCRWFPTLLASAGQKHTSVRHINQDSLKHSALSSHNIGVHYLMPQQNIEEILSCHMFPSVVLQLRLKCYIILSASLSSVCRPGKHVRFSRWLFPCLARPENNHYGVPAGQKLLHFQAQMQARNLTRGTPSYTSGPPGWLKIWPGWGLDQLPARSLVCITTM